MHPESALHPPLPPCAATAADPCLQAAVAGMRMPFCRIDGTMSADARRAEVARFQERDADLPVFLLTSQVGDR